MLAIVNTVMPSVSAGVTKILAVCRIEIGYQTANLKDLGSTPSRSTMGRVVELQKPDFYNILTAPKFP